MSDMIKCPKCDRKLYKSDYYSFKDNTLYTGMCKECVCNRINTVDPETFLPFLELFDIPFIKEQWYIYVAKAEQKSPFNVAPASKVFGKYLSCMKLSSYRHLTFKDSNEINVRYDAAYSKPKKEKTAWKAYEIYFDEDKQEYVAIQFEKNGNRIARADTCEIEIKDFIATGAFTNKYTEEEEDYYE